EDRAHMLGQVIQTALAMRLHRSVCIATGAFALFATATLTGTVAAQAPFADSATLSALRWRTIGPANFEGRVADVVGIPSPSNTFFVPAAGGAISKSTHAGRTLPHTL